MIVYLPLRRDEMIGNIESLFWGRLLTKHEIEIQLGQIIKENEAFWQNFERIPAIKEENGHYQCSRCNNSSEQLFAWIDDNRFHQERRYYCLNCLNMGRMIEGEDLFYLASRHKENLIPNGQQEFITWQGTLSPEQERASQELIESLSDPGIPHLVHAVTGAGKTEMIFPLINEVLKQGGRICIASPRIDVCLELYPRLKEAFKGVDMTLLYGASEEAYKYSPIVIATSHQLLRFCQAFDVLVMDEVDAFPFVNDPYLHVAAEKSVHQSSGKVVYLTATPDDRLIRQINNHEIKVTTLPARFHGYPLPVPKFMWIGDWKNQIQRRKKSGKLWRHLMGFIQGPGVKLIFMPDIRLAESLFNWMLQQELPYKFACVHSKDLERKEKVQALKQGDLDFLISTTILERGVTFTHCHVTIIGAEDANFSRSALVQMSGRVGRKKEFPRGHLFYSHFGQSKAMKAAKAEIISMNSLAQTKGLIRSED